jgi:hypothetical protein
MRPFLKIPALLLSFLLQYLFGFSQQENVQVRLNKPFFKPKDTLQIEAVLTDKKVKAATLFLMAENENGMVWEMRWPMLNGRCEPDLIIPDSLPQGQYRLHFSVLQNLFTVFGKIKTPEKVTLLNTTLLTAKQDVYESETPVNADGTFTYKNVLFEKDATLLFTLLKAGNSDNLNIEISTVLDSAIYPGTSKTLEIYIGETEPEKKPEKFAGKNDTTTARAQVLEAVTVYSKPLNRGELYNKKYSSGLFRDMNERMINLLDNPHLNTSFSALQLVRMQTAGINITGGFNPSARWRGDRVLFYIDEMPASILDVDRFPVNDIAIIKVYPPPFFGNPGGNGGAVAIYTKRGGLSDDNYKNAFKVKGYTPIISEFPLQPDRY